jgi:hypothetical protein
VTRDCLPDCHESRRVFVRQGAVEESVKYAEDRAGGSDTYGERENDHDDEAWIFEEASDSIAHVLQQPLHICVPLGKIPFEECIPSSVDPEY